MIVLMKYKCPCVHNAHACIGTIPNCSYKIDTDYAAAILWIKEQNTSSGTLKLLANSQLNPIPYK